jgi:Family of unknown function (DUF6655)
MRWPQPLLIAAGLLCAGVFSFAGCGITRSSDTARTATEQLLISDAIDRAVQSMNLRPLAGQTVYLDESKVTDVVDRNYYLSTLRQQLLANGCELREKREDADFVVEARAGAIGTDRNDLLFGVPSTTVPAIPLLQPVPAAIPEIPIAKRKDQRGIAKIAVFAYHRATGAPVWQSGIVRQESSANDVWILGAGPFQRGTIYDGTAFAGTAIKNEQSDGHPKIRRGPSVSVSQEALFTPPQQLVKQSQPATSQNVALAAPKESRPVVPATANMPAAASSASTASAMPPAVQTAHDPASASASSSPTPAAKTTTPVAAKPSVGAAASLEQETSKSLNSVFAKAAEVQPLPQPRFNSPR